MDFAPTGLGSVCFKAAEGAAFARTQTDVQQLLDSSSAGSAPKVELSKDSFGYTWLLVRHDPADVPGLVTDLHAVNSRSARRRLRAAAVVLTDLLRATPTGGGSRWSTSTSAARSIRSRLWEATSVATTRWRSQVQGTLADDMKIEPELNRWFPVWGAPGL